MGREDKKPKVSGALPPVKKAPREEVFAVGDQNPTWKLGRLDFDGPFCPKCLEQGKLVEITLKLGQLERQTWTELGLHGSHNVAVWKLVKPARDRLKYLQL